MKDILPAEAPHWQRLERIFRETVELYGFREVRTPIIEHTELFVRQVGEDTDIVEKEMYGFERHGDGLTVRPEGTAGVARAYVQHRVSAREPVSRWYYLGPMFRAERPAKGRYRQFHQAGCEHFGDPGPLCDAEMIEMLVRLLERVGIRSYAVHLSSLGSGGVRQRYKERLRQYLEPYASQLSEDSQRRLRTNPLRILDSKAAADREVVAGAPPILEVLDGEDAEHFAELRRLLDALGLSYVVDPTLVRGLDYYTRTLFELKTTGGELGAQDTLVGGGRYDGMVESLGGARVPAIGFAIGLERILALLESEPSAVGPDCYVAPLGEKARGHAAVLGRQLREQGVRCEVDGRGLSLRAMLRRANAVGSRLCLLLGEDEIERGQVTLKDLERRAQQSIPLEGAAEAVARELEEARADAQRARRANASEPPNE